MFKEGDIVRWRKGSIPKDYGVVIDCANNRIQIRWFDEQSCMYDLSIKYSVPISHATAFDIAKLRKLGYV